MLIGILSHVFLPLQYIDSLVLTIRDAALTESQRFWYLRLLNRLDTLSLDEIFTSKIEGDNGRKEAQALVARAIAKSAAPKAKVQQLMNLLMVCVVLL